MVAPRYGPVGGINGRFRNVDGASAMDPVEAVEYLLGCKEVVTSADATLVLVALSLDVQSAPAG